MVGKPVCLLWQADPGSAGEQSREQNKEAT